MLAMAITLVGRLRSLAVRGASADPTAEPAKPAVTRREYGPAASDAPPKSELKCPGASSSIADTPAPSAPVRRRMRRKGRTCGSTSLAPRRSVMGTLAPINLSPELKPSLLFGDPNADEKAVDRGDDGADKQRGR